LNYFGRILVTALFLERRLGSLNQVGVIDFLNQPPQNDLHALYLDDKARELLFDELRESFGKAVWPDTSRGNLLCLRVSDEDVLPSPADRLSHKKMSVYRTIESEGDGLKSYVATCVSLLLSRRPVCLIDEPEMCLHPPQAYNLGRFIGKHGSSTETATFVATHSSQILRGVIQSTRAVQIVRLTRRGASFRAHLVPADVLAEAVAKPMLRAESVLDGIFAQSVVVLEADGDRLVYQTVWESLASELRLDVHFAAVGGTGGIAETCRLYRALKIPIAVIADLDMIADADKFMRVVKAMTAPEKANALIREAAALVEEIRKLPPTVTPDEVKADLNRMIGPSLSWDGEGDVLCRRELNRIAKNLDRMRALKRGGVAVFAEPLRSRIENHLSEAAKSGVFLVPVGELEEWLATEGIKDSKEKKWAWASAAALVIQSQGAKRDDIWDFMRGVGRYLASK
jgi:hypothetical protein